MIKLYNGLINLGIQSDYDNNLIKRVKLINALGALWYFAFILTSILTVWVRSDFYSLIYVNLIGLGVIVSCHALNKKGKHDFAALGILLFTILYYLLLCCYVRPERFVEFFFVFVPSISLVFFDKKKFHWIIFIICVLAFHIPFLVFGYYQYETVLFLPPLMIFLFFVNFIIVYYFKQLNNTNEDKLEVAYQKLEETKKSELAHLQLKSLKAQMNPHFMFNAMNSIQSLVLKGDKHEAYQYLSKFSSMVRENLNMSEKSFVSFDEEISLLKKYLELEKLRFKKDFNYKLIGVDNIDNINIPSMIIQPFIENAIKHGLLHKTDGIKLLTVEFKQENVFKCIISDNGVGVIESKKIIERNHDTYQSFSTQAIKERLELLKDYYKTDIGFEYLPVNKGTKVVVKIPYTLRDE